MLLSVALNAAAAAALAALPVFAVELVHTTYSMSSVYGFKKANAFVRSQIHSPDLARNRYMKFITCPFILTT